MKKFSQVEIADATGIDKSTISKYLNGTVTPSLKVAEFIKKRTSLPLEIFSSPDAQKCFLSKVFLNESVVYVPKRRGK